MVSRRWRLYAVQFNFFKSTFAGDPVYSPGMYGWPDLTSWGLSSKGQWGSFWLGPKFPPNNLSLSLMMWFSYRFLAIKLSAVFFCLPFRAAIVLPKRACLVPHIQLLTYSCGFYSTVSLTFVCCSVFTVSTLIQASLSLAWTGITASHQHPCHLSPLTQISSPHYCHLQMLLVFVRNFQWLLCCLYH